MLSAKWVLWNKVPASRDVCNPLALEGLMFPALEHIVICVAARGNESLAANVTLPVHPRITRRCQTAHGMQARTILVGIGFGSWP